MPKTAHKKLGNGESVSGLVSGVGQKEVGWDGPSTVVEQHLGGVRAAAGIVCFDDAANFSGIHTVQQHLPSAHVSHSHVQRYGSPLDAAGTLTVIFRGGGFWSWFDATFSALFPAQFAAHSPPAAIFWGGFF